MLTHIMYQALKSRIKLSSLSLSSQHLNQEANIIQSVDENDANAQQGEAGAERATT